MNVSRGSDSADSLNTFGTACPENFLLCLPLDVLLQIIEIIEPAVFPALTEAYSDIESIVNCPGINRRLLRKWYYEPESEWQANCSEIPQTALLPTYLTLAKQERIWRQLLGFTNREFSLTLLRLHAHRVITRLGTKLVSGLYYRNDAICEAFCERFQNRFWNNSTPGSEDESFLDQAMATAQILVECGKPLNFTDYRGENNLVLYLDNVALAIRVGFSFEDALDHLVKYACINLIRHLLDQKLRQVDEIDETDLSSTSKRVAFEKLVWRCFQYPRKWPWGIVQEIRPSIDEDSKRLIPTIVDWLIEHQIKLGIFNVPETSSSLVFEGYLINCLFYVPGLKLLRILREPELFILKWLDEGHPGIVNMFLDWNLWIRAFEYYHERPELKQTHLHGTLKELIEDFVDYPAIQRGFEKFKPSEQVSEVLEPDPDNLFRVLKENSVGVMILNAILHVLSMSPYTNRDELAQMYTQMGKKRLAWVVRSFNPRKTSHRS
jgi:hypothetical protein